MSKIVRSIHTAGVGDRTQGICSHRPSQTKTVEHTRDEGVARRKRQPFVCCEHNSTVDTKLQRTTCCVVSLFQAVVVAVVVVVVAAVAADARCSWQLLLSPLLSRLLFSPQPMATTQSVAT